MKNPNLEAFEKQMDQVVDDLNALTQNLEGFQQFKEITFEFLETKHLEKKFKQFLKKKGLEVGDLFVR